MPAYLWKIPVFRVPSLSTLLKERIRVVNSFSLGGKLFYILTVMHLRADDNEPIYICHSTALDWLMHILKFLSYNLNTINFIKVDTCQ